MPQAALKQHQSVLNRETQQNLHTILTVATYYYARHHKTNQQVEVDKTVHFFLVQHPECSDLIYLVLLAAVHSLWVRRRPQPELRIAEVSVSVDIMQAFPDHLLLCEETLVCDQEVQLTLKNKTKQNNTLQHVTTPR